MPEMELAIVSETNATIANARMTTTTTPALLGRLKLRAGEVPNSTFVLSIGYALGNMKFCSQERTSVRNGAHSAGSSTGLLRLQNCLSM